MATLTLVLHLRQLYTDRVAAERDTRAALLGKLALSEETARLADDRARALADVRARDRLLEGSAHDTRHVLHALNSAVHFSKAAGGPDSPPADLIALLEASAHHLEDIIASSVSIGNRDGRFLALSVSDPGATIEGLADIYAPIAQRDRIVLTVESSCAGKAIVDEALYARLISNLLNNAIKFTEAGTVTLECKGEEGLLRLTVRDTGPGMPAELAAWLNEHAGDTLAPDLAMRVGTGWRAIREIVALMQGSYVVESDASGTAVTVVLPNPALDGVHALSLDELAAAEPGLRLCDIGELQRAAGAADGRVTVVVADDARAETRVASAAQSQLLLVRPLCRRNARPPLRQGAGQYPCGARLFDQLTAVVGVEFAANFGQVERDGRRSDLQAIADFLVAAAARKQLQDRLLPFGQRHRRRGGARQQILRAARDERIALGHRAQRLVRFLDRIALAHQPARAEVDRAAQRRRPGHPGHHHHVADPARDDLAERGEAVDVGQLEVEQDQRAFALGGEIDPLARGAEAPGEAELVAVREQQSDARMRQLVIVDDDDRPHARTSSPSQRSTDRRGAPRPPPSFCWGIGGPASSTAPELHRADRSGSSSSAACAVRTHSMRCQRRRTAVRAHSEVTNALASTGFPSIDASSSSGAAKNAVLPSRRT